MEAQPGCLVWIVSILLAAFLFVGGVSMEGSGEPAEWPTPAPMSPTP
jgi:hypothetical protein